MSLKLSQHASRRLQLAAAALAALTLALAAAAVAPRAAAADCDRDCLTGIAADYMTALAAQDGSALPWAERVRFTENDVALMVGDGLWATVSRVHEPQMVLADPETGNVLWYGVVEEHGDAAYLMARIKVEEQRVAEVETVVSREGTPAHFEHPDGYRIDSVYEAVLSDSERRPRARMIALVEGYYNTKQLNDGVLLGELAPDCTRVSNGVTTTHGEHTPVEGCQAQFEIGLYKPVDRVRARRYPLVDEERGIVAAFAYLDHAARYVEYETLDGGTARIPVEYPNSHRVVELFKVRDGAVERVEGIAVFQLYLMPALWMR